LFIFALMELPSRFPPPWSVDDDGGCLIVRAADGQAVAYIYYFDEEQGYSGKKLVCREEAAECIASLPNYTSESGMTIETKLASKNTPHT
jgi:hypothetical protein